MPAKPLLLDVSCLCDRHTDGALEFMAKAIGEDPPGGDIWAPHPNPFIRRLVELFTERGLERTAGLEEELRRWIGGEERREGLERPARPEGGMGRWSEAELSLTRLYLQSLPPEQFTLDDWLMLVDYLVQRYLPATDLRTEAEWLATRSQLMGRVQAAMGEATEACADRIVAALPTVEEVGRQWGMTPLQRAIIDYGRARCAESVTALSDSVRHRLRKVIVDYQEAVFTGDRAAASEALQSKLLDEFGAMNRDWRRIAVTESTENCNQGFVAAQPYGSRVRRVEKYRGACPFCRSIDGKVFTVVDPSATDKDGDTQVWTGKTNIGRSASPRRRDGGVLVDREPHERWWPAAGAMHPHCRGAWAKVTSKASPDPEFERWLGQLGKRNASSADA